jgi:formylmethanofuran dehydrogenase subunit E
VPRSSRIEGKPMDELKDITTINTLDGPTFVFWHLRSYFRNKKIQIFGGGEVQTINIPDEKIICDFCNELIPDEEIPVLGNTHALCQSCYKDVQKTPDQVAEYFRNGGV